MSRASRIASLVSGAVLVAIFAGLGVRLGGLESSGRGETSERMLPAALDRLADPIESTFEITGRIERGDILAAVMTKAGASRGIVDGVLDRLASVFDPRKARPGDTFSLRVGANESLVGFEYNRVTGECYRVEPRREGLAAFLMPSRLERRVIRREGALESSLFDAVKASGGTAEEVDQFADLFGGSLDFFTESRKGDTFSYLVEGFFDGTRQKKSGRLLLAEYASQAKEKTLSGIYFQPDAGRSGSYYAADGAALSRRFLKAPLPYSRISSRFSAGRLHPVLNTRRPHLGVDYAAPAGTPVSTVADGVVIQSGRMGGLGNAVKVRHGGGVTTVYGHLSRIARRTHPGSRVVQGDVIGYVGSTGLSTGPHLHFSIEKNGRPVDPLRFESPGGPPLPAEQLPAFSVARDQLFELRLALPVNVLPEEATGAEVLAAAPTPPDPS